MADDIVVCPVCPTLVPPLTSTVRRGAVQTTIAPAEFYDANGVFHRHDYAYVGEFFMCDKGHIWVVAAPPACPAGDFGGSPLTFVTTQV